MPPTHSPEAAPTPSLATSPSSPTSTTKLFSCEFCSFTTHNAPSIKKHRARHTGEGMMQCGECSYQTIHPYLMKIHNATYHTGEGLIRCPHCKFMTARRERYRHHLNIHIKSGEALPNALQLFNDKCAKETQEKRKAERLRIREESQKRATGTQRLGSMRVMASTSNSLENDSNSSSSTSSFQSNRSALKIASDSSLNTLVHCDELKKQLFVGVNVREDSLNSYTNGRSNISDQENIIQFESSSDGDGFSVPTESYVCNRCDFVSFNKRIFVRHKMKHDQERMFCEFCSFSSSDKACMEVHNASHEGVRKALCPFCEFSSTSQFCLRRHVISHSSSTSHLPSSTDVDNDTDVPEDLGDGLRGTSIVPSPLERQVDPSVVASSCLENYYHTKGFLFNKIHSSQKLSSHSKQNIYLQTSGVMFDEYCMTMS